MNLSCKLIFLTPVILVAASLLTGCDISSDSADNVIRQVGINVQGYYTGNPIVSQNSGASITVLNLMQDGDQLQAVDNNNLVFRGTIGQAIEGSSATFSLGGATTEGNEATITGTIVVSGTQATMQGTWIEDTFLSSVYATATVPSNAPPSSLSISGPGTMTVGQTNSFTASGSQSGNYTWSIANSGIGAPTSGSGTTFDYAAIGSGTQTIQVSDGRETATKTVIQN